ncbi:MAG: translocase [Bacillota bacterium]|jgi:AAA family ATP:ADP antiporter
MTLTQKLVKYFYPNMTDAEVRKFSILGLAFFMIVGAYWGIRLAKNTLVWTSIVPEKLGWAKGAAGILQPQLKIAAPVVIGLAVGLFSLFTNKVRRDKLYCGLLTVFAVIFGIATIFYFTAGDIAAGKTLFPAPVVKWIGITTFLMIESFGSLGPVMFWAFVNSLTLDASAKRGYPLVGAMGGIGAIIFSALVGIFQSNWLILASGTAAFVAAIMIIRYFVKHVPRDAEAEAKLNQPSPTEKEIKTGAPLSFGRKVWGKLSNSGVILILKNPYVLGVTLISTLYEIVSQVVDYQMHSVASGIYPSEQAMNSFESKFGMAVNSVLFFSSLLGIPQLFKKLNTRVLLMLYPLITTGVIATLILYNLGIDISTTAPVAVLIVTATALALLKGVGYSLNNPVKEILWLPTSKNIKFKSKGWIDAFGARMAKMGGGSINAAAAKIKAPATFGYYISLGFIGVWLLAAAYTGAKNMRLIKKNQIIQ